MSAAPGQTLAEHHARIVEGVTLGMTSRELAARLGVNRNTLLGYCQRHGISWKHPANNHPDRRVAAKPRQRNPLTFNTVKVAKLREAAREGRTALYDGVRDLKQELYPEPVGVALVDARPNQCRRPTWGPGERLGLYCGRPVKPGSSWCPECHARILVKPERRK